MWPTHTASCCSNPTIRRRVGSASALSTRSIALSCLSIYALTNIPDNDDYLIFASVEVLGGPFSVMTQVVHHISRRAVAEALGTTALLATVVGSGIMGDRLSGGNVAIALMANAIATGAMLVVLIMALGPISGAHFNPVVTLVTWRAGGISLRDAVTFVAVQCIAAAAGVIL